MITYEEALEIAKGNIAYTVGYSALMILEGHTIEKSYGWLFFYNTKEYIETGNFSACLAGNSPFLVDRMEGRIHPTGSSAYGTEHYIALFDKQFGV